MKPPDHDPDRVLLVCPPFFSYHRAIRSTLEEAGHSVVWWSDRASEAVAYKAALRLSPRAIGFLSGSCFAARLRRLGARPFDRILVVKGEGLSVGVMRRLRAHSPRAVTSLYMWDAVRNVRNALRVAPLFDHVATFDPEDARRFGWRHLPLFAWQASPAAGGAPEPVWDWAFVGTLHSDRHRVLQRIRSLNPELRGAVRGYVPGRAMLIARRLVDWSLVRAPPGSVSHRPMSVKEVADVIGHARAIVDIEHPSQRGLTIRTIETLLAGKKLITTNRHVLDSDLNDPTRVQVIDRERPRISAEFISSPLRPVPEAVAQRYLLRNWLEDVLTGGASAVYHAVRHGSRGGPEV